MNLEDYNPLNARRLTKEQIDNMQLLTIDDIKELARMFPKAPRESAYLILKNKKLLAQNDIHHMTTWPGLYNLISKQGQTQYIPFSFRILFNKTTKQQPEIPLGKVQDLTREEIVQAEGLKFVNDYMPGFPQMVERTPIKHEPLIKEQQANLTKDLVEFLEKPAPVKRSHKKK